MAKVVDRDNNTALDLDAEIETSRLMSTSSRQAVPWFAVPE
ncbi:hypothetical protein [Amycolatopsis sp.]|jgi:hypothetical protein|nr:hypothetical protein [Amycolatopsis sp.]